MRQRRIRYGFLPLKINYVYYTELIEFYSSRYRNAEWTRKLNETLFGF